MHFPKSHFVLSGFTRHLASQFGKASAQTGAVTLLHRYGAEGQLPVAAVAPGDTDYHGGKWAVHVVLRAPQGPLDPM